MKKKYPFQIGTKFNDQMRCHELQLLVGGIDSKEELEALAKLLAEFVAGEKSEVNRFS